MLVCPESPTWLQLKGRRREADEIGEKLWGEEAAAAQLGAGAPAAGGWVATVCFTCKDRRQPPHSWAQAAGGWAVVQGATWVALSTGGLLRPQCQ